MFYLLCRETCPLFSSFKQPAENGSFPLINGGNLHSINIFINHHKKWKLWIGYKYTPFMIKVKLIIRWQTFGLSLPDGWSLRAASSFSVSLFWEKMLNDYSQKHATAIFTVKLLHITKSDSSLQSAYIPKCVNPQSMKIQNSILRNQTITLTLKCIKTKHTLTLHTVTLILLFSNRPSLFPVSSPFSS